jgi:Tfp pilus assembly protein PilN
MKARLNLSTAPLQGNRRFAVSAASAAVVGLLALFLLGQRAYQVWRAETNFRAEQAQIDSEMDRFRKERQELEQFFSRPDTVQRRDLAGFLNSLIAERAFPWTRIFMEFESSLPPGVRIVSIEPRLVEHYVQLRLTVGATNDASKLEFLRRLEGSKSFSHIQVEGERRGDSAVGDSGEIVVLLQARYSAG